MLKIAVLASGRGSNFQSIIDAIESGYIQHAAVDMLITDKADAFAVDRAKKHGIDALHLDPGTFGSMDDFFIEIAEILKERGIELIVLAGFMRIVKKPLIDAFPNRILNIHPAILPSFPGLHGQEQAFDYGVKLAGCTVHFVDEGMDTGPVIIQAAVPVYSDDTEDSISERILKFEHQIYPHAVKLFVDGRLKVSGRKVIIKDEKKHDTFLMNPIPGD
ncbi:MAG: phosphoribosylglycinamide formyltransferase [Nitrospirota bacterium]|nr:MAG: phosphoribosylglycinamide formyltransferase [Nitrospirota bacterium]